MGRENSAPQARRYILRNTMIKSKRMNWKIIASNLREALEQLDEVQTRIDKKDYPAEGELQVLLEHVYHHINCA